MWNPFRAYRESILRRLRDVETNVIEHDADLEQALRRIARIEGKMRHGARGAAPVSETPAVATAGEPIWPSVDSSPTLSTGAPAPSFDKARARQLARQRGLL